MVWRNPAQPGSPTARNFLPWYERTDFVCGNCQQGFRLDEADFIVGHGPFMGSNLDQHLYWRKFATTTVAGVIDPATAGTDGFQNTYYPDQIYGPCPFCGFQNAYVSADYGAAHPADASGIDPTIVGVLRATIAAGAASVAYWLTNDDQLVAIYLDGNGAIWQQANGYATAFTRIVAGDFSAAYSYPLSTPARPLTAAAARLIDAPLSDLLSRSGLVVN
jgi:hypothetical protein